MHGLSLIVMNGGYSLVAIDSDLQASVVGARGLNSCGTQA